MSDPGLRLETRQLVITSTTTEDLPELLALWNNGAVMRWVNFPDGLGYDLARMREWFSRLQARPDRTHFTVRRRDGAFCGELFAARYPERRRASLDIKFVPEAQGGRRSREALSALIGWVFESFPDVDAVWTEPNPGNLAAETLYYSCGLRRRPRPADLWPASSYWELSRENRVVT